MYCEKWHRKVERVRIWCRHRHIPTTNFAGCRRKSNRKKGRRRWGESTQTNNHNKMWFDGILCVMCVRWACVNNGTNAMWNERDSVFSCVLIVSSGHRQDYSINLIVSHKSLCSCSRCVIGVRACAGLIFFCRYRVNHFHHIIHSTIDSLSPNTFSVLFSGSVVSIRFCLFVVVVFFSAWKTISHPLTDRRRKPNGSKYLLFAQQKSLIKIRIKCVYSFPFRLFLRSISAWRHGRPAVSMPIYPFYHRHIDRKIYANFILYLGTINEWNDLEKSFNRMHRMDRNGSEYRILEQYVVLLNPRLCVFVSDPIRGTIIESNQSLAHF